MQLPTIHLNGSSQISMVESLCMTSAALETALMALKQTAPNNRDYYPQGREAYETALQEHISRMYRLNSLKNEVDELAIAIDSLG
jgi:hypothetical protein